MDAIQITEDLAESTAKLLNKTHQQAQRVKDREADEYRTQLAQLDEKENRLYDLLVDGALDAETFRRQQGRLWGERNRLFELLQEAQRQIDGAYLVVAQKVLSLGKNAKTPWEFRLRQERRDFLGACRKNGTMICRQGAKIAKNERKNRFLGALAA